MTHLGFLKLKKEGEKQLLKVSQTYTHSGTSIRANTRHMRTHTHTLVHVQRQIPITYACIHTLWNMYKGRCKSHMHTHIHTLSHVQGQTYTHVDTHRQIHKCMHTHIGKCKNTYAYIHALIPHRFLNVFLENYKYWKQMLFSMLAFVILTTPAMI